MRSLFGKDKFNKLIYCSETYCSFDIEEHRYRQCLLRISVFAIENCSSRFHELCAASGTFKILGIILFLAIFGDVL